MPTNYLLTLLSHKLNNIKMEYSLYILYRDFDLSDYTQGLPFKNFIFLYLCVF